MNQPRRTPQFPRRPIAAATLALIIFFCAVPLAAAGVRIHGVDTTAYPTIRLTVVTSSPYPSPPQVREDGQPVAGASAQTLAHNKSVVLIVDRSQSMRGAAIKEAKLAAQAFVSAKPDSDRIAVFAVGFRPLLVSRFSSDPAVAETALSTIAIDRHYGTALYDTLVAAARALRSESQGGRVIILLTDGQEVSSKASLPDVIAAARRADAIVFPIGIESSHFQPRPLTRIARQTGGSYYGSHSLTKLPAIYAAIASELRRSWRVQYDTAARPGDEIHLRVTFSPTLQASASLRLPGQPPTPSNSNPLLHGTGLALLIFGTPIIGLVLVLLARWLRSQLRPVRTDEDF
jgi:tight adherence protein B